MATFLADMMEKGYTQDEVFAVVFESEREEKRREMLVNVTKTVDAHRLEKMRELLANEKLVTSRRMNGFDRDVNRVDDWRSLSPTPQEFSSSLRYELQKLKDAISMPNEELAVIKRLGEKREDFIDKNFRRKRWQSLEAIPWTSCLQISNLQESRNTWRSEAARQHR